MRITSIVYSGRAWYTFEILFIKSVWEKIRQSVHTISLFNLNIKKKNTRRYIGREIQELQRRSDLLNCYCDQFYSVIFCRISFFPAKTPRYRRGGKFSIGGLSRVVERVQETITYRLCCATLTQCFTSLSKCPFNVFSVHFIARWIVRFFALCPIFFGIIKNFVWINYINKDSHSEIAFLINFYYFFLMIKFSCKLHTFHITRIIYFLFCIFYKCYKYKMIRSHKYLKLMEFINIYMFFDWST